MVKHAVRPTRSWPGTAFPALAFAVCAMGLAAPITAQDTEAPTEVIAAQDAEAPTKIAVVSLDQVALQSPAGQALQQEIIQFQADLTTELRVRQQAAQDIEQRVGEADSLSVDERRSLERQYQDALTELQRFQQDKQEQADALRVDGLSRIQQELGPVIEAIQTELGYDLVLNSQNGLIVIYSERIDITQMVIDRLQAAGSAGADGS